MTDINLELFLKKERTKMTIKKRFFTVLMAFLAFIAFAFVILIAVDTKPADASTRIATIAKKYVGLHEHKHTRTIRRLIGHDPRGRRNAWCSSFTCAVVRKAGFRCPRYYKSARSFLKWGKRVSLRNIRRGDIVVFSRGKGKGHNGVFIKWGRRGQMLLVSANDGNAVKERYRSTRRLIGVRRGVRR